MTTNTELKDARAIELIVADVQKARVEKTKIDWTVGDLVNDMAVVLNTMNGDMIKFQFKGNKAAGKRVRTYTKVLETLGKAFRLESVK